MISKTDYKLFEGCHKALWLNQHKSQICDMLDLHDLELNDKKAVMNELVMQFREKSDKIIDIDEWSSERESKIDLTTKFFESENTIINGVFEYDGFVATPEVVKVVDKDSKKISAALVKINTVASADFPDVVYNDCSSDVNFTYHILKMGGYDVCKMSVIALNSAYTTNNGQPLFFIFDVTNFIDTTDVEHSIESINSIVKSSEEVASNFSMSCKECQFFKYCTKDFPEYNVFNIYRMNFDKKIQNVCDGNIAYEDLFDKLKDNPKILNKNQLIQVETTINEGRHIDKTILKKFIDKVRYPIYYLDFETQMPPVPKVENLHPYGQEVFQFSLHIEQEDGTLTHKEFLGVSGKDNRREIAELLCEYIPMDSCIMAYNKQFECGRLKELAELYPDLKEHLLNIESNIVDLLEPFRGFGYYLPKMKGSFSIKKVLPAVFPDDPELNYSNLDDVHNGSDAMTIFPQIQYMTEEKQNEVRKSLLKYCGLDTYAMVKLYNKIIEDAK